MTRRCKSITIRKAEIIAAGGVCRPPNHGGEKHMSLYSEWRQAADAQRAPHEQEKFWNDYFALETENYKKILANHAETYAGELSGLAETFGMDEVTFIGFLDGINTSLKQEIDLESLESSTVISLDVDFEKLYFNMLDAKADWLYHLKEWDDVLSEEKRHEITKEFRASKVFVKQETVGRNDPCPCGSGKKYKKCCGKDK